MILGRFTGVRRPSGVHEEEAETASVGHLQELYTVAVGLALTLGVERFVTRSALSGIRVEDAVGLAAFVATLLPFYHGAMRHLDHSYIFTDRTGNYRRGILLLDFVLLFLEAGLLIAMGALISEPPAFVWALVTLLLLDVVWLEAFIAVARHTENEGAGLLGKHERGWVTVNVPFIVLILCLALWSELRSPGVTLVAIAVGIAAIGRTVVDYWWNWQVYFPTEPR